MNGRREAAVVGQSQRDWIMQPSVADGIGYAGWGIKNSPNPEGVASLALARDLRRCNPFRVGGIFPG